MKWTAAAAIALALAVMIGAFGAHGLRGRISEEMLAIYERAVFYHAVHALGMLMVSLMPRMGVLGERRAGWVAGLLLAGIVLFSGSLYALAITGVTLLGAVTPLGGIAFIAAWLLLAWWVITRR